MILNINPTPEEYLNLMILVFLIVPFSFMMFTMPYIVKKLRDSGHLVNDMYKLNQPKIPTNGGLVILLVAIFSLSILTLFYGKLITPINYTIIVVVVLFALFGLLDDMINIGRPAKLILLYYCSYPLIPFITTTVILFPLIGSVDFSAIYLQIIIPTYVPVVANLVNMHSGFNGLAPGVSLMILGTLVLKVFFLGNIFNILFIVCLTGAMLGYFWFEKYPSRIFWGNVGALSIGAAIGATIVTQGFIISGLILLIPHIVNFLMYVYWRLNPARYPIAKFGKILDNGILEVPNPLTLKWLFPYYFPMTEQRATHIMYSITLVCCIIGFYIPG